MSRDPIIPPMDVTPEGLARRLLRQPKDKKEEPERRPKTRGSRRRAAAPTSQPDRGT